MIQQEDTKQAVIWALELINEIDQEMMLLVFSKLDLQFDDEFSKLLSLSTEIRQAY